MPQLGDTRKAKDVGFDAKKGGSVVWVACKVCGRQRWVQVVGGKPRCEYCRVCAQTYNRVTHRGANHYNWKGGDY